MRRNLIGATLVALFLTLTLQADAQTVEFDFRSTGGAGVAGGPTNFDPSAAGDIVIVDELTVTIVDITAPEYDVTGALPVETGNTLSSAAGGGVITNVSGQNALGIQNLSINNADFDLIGDGAESSDLNPGETVTFTFDRDVEFTVIELESVNPADIFNVLVDGDAMLETMGDDSFVDDLGALAGLSIPAGTEITFEVDGVLETATGGPSTSIRVESFTVVDSAGVEVVFDFRNGGSGVANATPNNTFDSGPAGDSATVDGLTATIVDVTALEYDTAGALPELTGNTLSSAAGDGVVTNISGENALGIQNPSIFNADFGLIGDGNESSDLNPGESFTITFDQAVQFTAIELENVAPEDSFDVLVDGVAVLETMGDDEFIDDLGGLAGLTIAAGSEVTFAVDGPLENATGGPTTNLRIETFTVEIDDSFLLGDVNRDGVVDFLDISPFIVLLSTQEFQAEADIDGNGVVDFLDISPFIIIISS